MRWFLEGQGDNIKIYYLQTPLESVGNRNIFPLAADSSAYQLCPNKQRDFFFLTSVLFHSLPFPVFTLSALALLTMGFMSQGLFRSPLNASGMGAFHPASSHETAEPERSVLSVCRFHCKAAALESSKPVFNTTWQFSRLFEGILPHNPCHSLLAINSYCFLDFCFKNHLCPQVGRRFL